MNAMQAFYDQLFVKPNVKGSYFHCLAALTRTSLGQLARLKSDLAWYPWSPKLEIEQP